MQHKKKILIGGAVLIGATALYLFRRNKMLSSPILNQTMNDDFTKGVPITFNKETFLIEDNLKDGVERISIDPFLLKRVKTPLLPTYSLYKTDGNRKTTVTLKKNDLVIQEIIIDWEKNEVNQTI